MDSRIAAARERLERALLARPEVRLIDVGRDRDTHALFLRVHLAPGTDPAALGIPAQVGDLPVQVLFAEYRLR